MKQNNPQHPTTTNHVTLSLKKLNVELFFKKHGTAYQKQSKHVKRPLDTV